MELVQTITSLAMLKVNADSTGSDYLDYLIPFASHILIKNGSDPIAVETVKQGIREEFGLKIPLGPIDLLLRRLVKQGKLRKDSGLYYASSKLEVPNIEQKRLSARNSVTQVIQGFINFAQSTYAQEISEERATNALTAYLHHFCIECLGVYAQQTALPKLPQTKDQDMFLVNAYIDDTRKKNSPLFEDIVVLVKGHMLANALICPDLESTQRKFGEVTFFLDTPFIVRLLRVQGDPNYFAAEELIELLKRLKASLAVFHHTAQEVAQLLTWCENHLEDWKARAPIILELRKAGKTRADLIIIRNRLDDFYGQYGIARTPAPKHVGEFQIDEAILQDAISDEIKYWSPRALECDITSIRSIYTLRKGLAPYRLENARAVLLTTNSRLARAAYLYGKNFESSREVASVITDFSLGNVAWLKAPMGSDLPRREIVATCYAAMDPPSKLWMKYLDEIQKLRQDGKISPSDHEALRLSYRAREELMNLTLGAEQSFSAKTISDILLVVKDEISREHVEKLEQEQLAHEATRLKLNNLEREREEHRKSIYWKSQRVGKVTSALFMIMLSLVVIVGSLFATESFGPYFRNPELTTVINVVAVTAFLLAILHAILGLSVQKLSKKIAEIAAASYYYRKCKAVNIKFDI